MISQNDMYLKFMVFMVLAIKLSRKVMRVMDGRTNGGGKWIIVQYSGRPETAINKKMKNIDLDIGMKNMKRGRYSSQTSPKAEKKAFTVFIVCDMGKM